MPSHAGCFVVAGGLFTKACTLNKIRSNEFGKLRFYVVSSRLYHSNSNSFYRIFLDEQSGVETTQCFGIILHPPRRPPLFLRLVPTPARSTINGLGLVRRPTSSASSVSNLITLRSIQQNGLGRERADGLVRATPRPSRRSAHGLGIYSSSQSTGVNSPVHSYKLRN